MRDIDLFLGRVLSEAPLCPQPRAYRAIRAAAREACQRLRLWRISVTETVTAPSYTVTPAVENAEVFLIEAARMGDIDLTPVKLIWLDENRKGWQDAEPSTPAQYITQLRMGSFLIYPKAEGELSLRLVLQPSQSAHELPAELYDLFADQIGHGAAADVLGDVAAPYGNPGKSVALRASFEAWLNTTASRALGGQQRARTRTRPMYF